jgi:two-component system chemotaxis response regulator CheY
MVAPGRDERDDPDGEIAPTSPDSLGKTREKTPAAGTKTSVNTGVRILIADDQKDVGTTLAALVCCCKHEVVEVVGSGLEAINAYKRHHPDVVLMDYWMSKLNGATACRNIVAQDPSARVILVSGFSPCDHHPSDSGAIAVLQKPVGMARLEQALNEATRVNAAATTRFSNTEEINQAEVA